MRQLEVMRTFGRAGALSVLSVLSVVTFARCVAAPETDPPPSSTPSTFVHRSGSGTLHLLLTDAPLEGVEAVLVTISQIEVRFAGADPVLLLDQPVVVDLLELRDGVATALGVAELPAGVIHQIRLIVVEAEIVVDGESFPLRVPSGAQTGIKLSRPGGFLIAPNATTTVIADFDAEESIHETGNGFQLQPVVRLVDVIFLQVTSPRPGQFIGTDTVIVEGVFDAMLPIISITVNGVEAMLAGGTFSAVGVPVAPHGTTTLTIVATDADGFTAVLALMVGKAAGLMPEAKIGVSDPGLSVFNPRARTWMVSSTGELLARTIGPITADLLPAWRNFGTPGPFVGAGGISAVSFECGLEVHERAYFIGEDGALWEKRVTDNLDAGWASLGVPPAAMLPLSEEVEALTGRFGVVGVSPFLRRLYVMVVDSAGGVWLVRNDDPCELVAPPWGWESQGLADPDTPIAGAVNTSGLENPAFFFFHAPNGELRRIINQEVGPWFELPAVFLGDTRCAALDAVVVPDGPHPAVDRRVMCLATGGLFDGSVLDLGETAVIGNHGPPPGTSALPRAHGIAVTEASDVFHTFVLGADGHIWRLRTGAETGWDDVGAIPDTSGAFGGFAAFETGSAVLGNSIVHFVGIGQLTDAYYLARRDLTRTPGWGLPGTDVRVRATLTGPDAYAESRMAEHEGKILTGVIRRSDEVTPAEVFTTWSTTDGLETDPPQLVPLFPGSDPRPYVTDPTTVFRSDGTGLVTMLGIDPPCTTAFVESSIWTCETTDGTLDSSSCHEIHSGVGVLDHPWTAVTSPPAGDTIHHVWWDFPGALEYCQESDLPGASIDCVNTPVILAPGLPTGAPTMTSDAVVSTVYIAWAMMGEDVRFCRLPLLTFGQCDFLANLDLATSIDADTAQDISFGPAVVDRIRTLQAWSLVASPNVSGRLYYAAHTCEPDPVVPGVCLPVKDIMFSMSEDGGETWSPPIFVNEAPGDGTDQFFPAITVTGERGDFDGDGFVDDRVVVTYYDRMSTPTSIWPRVASFVRGLNQFVGHTFLHDPETPTEAFSLPRNCITDTLFIGDYHEGTRGRVHSHATLTEAHEDEPGPNGDIWEIYVGQLGL